MKRDVAVIYVCDDNLSKRLSACDRGELQNIMQQAIESMIDKGFSRFMLSIDEHSRIENYALQNSLPLVYINIG